MIENIAVPVYYIVVTLNPDVILDSLFLGREGSKVVTCLHTHTKKIPNILNMKISSG